LHYSLQFGLQTLRTRKAGRRAVEQQNQGKAIVRLAGSVTVRTIAEAHQGLLEAFADNSEIIVDASDVTEHDLTFVQLLLSARRTAVEQGKHFALASAPTGELLETLKRGGFVDPTAATDDFWFPTTDQN
jgi:anti-anti-sigma regulatory factor